MSLNHYQFNYAFYGDKPSASGKANRRKPIILFLHGFMGSGTDFAEVIDLLSPYFCCLTVDLPGHGATQVKGGEFYYQMSETAQALIELLQKLEIDHCFLLGYSMGGRLALYLAIHFPIYFKKVILESASPGLTTASAREQRVQQDLKLAQELESIDFKVFLAKWYSNPLFDSLRNHPHYQQAIAQRLRNNPLELAKSLRNMSLGLQPSLWNKLNRVRVPLILLVGELDRKFRLINTKIVRQNHHIQLKIIAQCGHNIHFETPRQFANIIQSIPDR